MSRLISNLLLTIVLLLAAILRWKGADTFMQDELSALGRLNFDSLAEVIDKGVRPDGHPALTQLFLYLWTALFGMSEGMVKLPFVLSGVASVWLLYRIGEKAYDRRTALMAAVVMATLQYFITYSQLARPYAFGTLICLWQAWLLVSAVRDERSPTWPLVMIAMALSVYTHYFSALVSIVIGLGSYALLDRAGRIAQTKAIIGAVLLFLPHLPITLGQLGYGGLGSNDGWLAAPKADFFIDFLRYLSQFGSVGYWVLLLSALLLIRRITLTKRLDRRLSLLFLAAGVIPYVIGHAYSIWQDPILQYSLLIFGAPLLILALCSAWRMLPAALLIGALPLIGGYNIYHLVEEREHYEVMKRQPLAHAADEVSALNAQGKRPLLLSPSAETFFYPYVAEDALRYDFFLVTEKTSLRKIDAAIEAHAGQGVVWAKPTATHQQYAADRWVDLQWWQGFYQGVLSSAAIGENEANGSPDTSFSERCVTDVGNGRHQAVDFQEGQEWGPSCDYALGALLSPKRERLEVKATLSGEGEQRPVTAVIEIESSGEQLVWRGYDSELNAIDEDGVTTLYGALYLNELDLGEYGAPDSLRLITYLWNKGMGARRLTDLSLRTRPIHTGRYHLFEPLLKEE